MPILDLHMHSRFSDDGEFSPEQLLERGHTLGLRAMAITDHNSVKGVEGGIRRGAELGIEVIPAVEIDCSFRGRNFHLLGYFIDWTRREYFELEEDITRQEEEAFEHKAANLVRLGLPVDQDAVRALAHGPIIGAECFAEHLLQREDCAQHPLLAPYRPGGARSEMPLVNFYWDFFAQGRPAHVPMRFMPLEEAVSLVHSSGGVPVLAHPGVNLKPCPELLAPILSAGVKGLEVFSTYHDEATRNHFLSTALERGLLVTCGSDFHGRNKPGIELGGHGCDLDETRILKDLKQAAGRG
jgi:predicted metal-dependent phosphoesterase TrpH